MSAAVHTFTRCRDCDRPLSSARPKPHNFARYGAYGRCQACDTKLVRAGLPRNTRRPDRVLVRASTADTWPARA